jgi:hypothetical protein
LFDTVTHTHVSRLFALTLTLLAWGVVAKNPDAYCYPGMTCFPGDDVMAGFSQHLDGTVLFPSSEGYANKTIMRNTRLTRFPIAIVLVKSVEDVQKTLALVRKYNLHVTIQSSGHGGLVGCAVHLSSVITRTTNTM